MWCDEIPLLVRSLVSYFRSAFLIFLLRNLGNGVVVLCLGGFSVLCETLLSGYGSSSLSHRYHGASAMAFMILDWHRCMSFILDSLA